MKKMIGLMALLSVGTLMAGEMTLVKVKTLGPMNHKVIFQSSNVLKVKGSNVVRGKLVAQWGTEVFEVVTGFYTCNTKNVCKLSDYERVATYESCKVKNKKVSCANKLSGDSSSNSTDVSFEGTPDDVIADDRLRDSHHFDKEEEFPTRIQDEFSGIF